tara:strand:- start:417 stop:1541 length:1125 start_codon:yes stop_codon:yes gene_type:complete
MNVILFFTYGVSLKDWESSGLLSREIKQYKTLSEKYNINFTFVTYGDNDEYKYNNYFKNLKIFPIYSFISHSNSKLIRIIKSLYIPFLIKRKLGAEYEILKTNQLNGSWVAIIFKLITKIPLIIRTGYDLFTFSKYEKKNIIKRIFYYILTLFSLNFSNLYSVSSKTDYNFLKDNFIFNKNKLIIIPNWVDSIEILPSKKRANKVLVIGRMEKQKNFELIINSLKNTEFDLDIFGEGSLKSKLKEASKNSNNINFLGIKPHEELMNEYEKYQFYISLSSHEGNPKTTLEAMGSGCVVIVSNIPNNREIVSHLETGVLIEPEKDNLINTLREICKKTDLINKIRINSINYIENNNSIDKVISREFEEYKKLSSFN